MILFQRGSFSRRRMLALGAGGGLALTTHRHARGQESDAAALIAAMSPREQAARMFMLPLSATSLTTAEETWLRELKPGGVILVRHNFGTPEEVRALVAAIYDTNLDLPPLVALDQEGGIVSRIEDDPAPDAPTLGALSAAEISRLAAARAGVIASYGFDVNFAPVADIAFSSDSFMSGRTFGDDPESVAADVAAYLEGALESGVLHCVKHFPGHGRVSVDSHEALPVLDVDPDIWWDEDALPFRVAVDLGTPMVMLGHLMTPRWGELPASLSPETVRVLRQELGFAGTVVSDDLGMGALAAWEPLEIVDLAVTAGNDLLLYVILNAEPAELVDHLAARVENGEIPPARVAESVMRLLAMQLDAARQR